MANLALFPFLPEREGMRPATDKTAPHTQVEQLADPETRLNLSRELAARLKKLDHLQTGTSRRAPQGSIAFHLDSNVASGTSRSFMLDTEIAHIHAEDDGSLHAILPEPVRTQAIEAGWAEPHPFAGRPTVSEDIVMIYAPRTQSEVETIVRLVSVGYANALRNGLQP